jgi:endonuclease YncB( thermonuclease family)
VGPLPLSALVSLVIAAVLALAETALAQSTQPATVTHVIDGRTLTARLADGRELTVRAIGIDVPVPPSECAATDATDALRLVVDDQPVNLVSDPYQPTLDAAGSWLFYIDRASDGLDAGQHMVRLGLARIQADEFFERLDVYQTTQREARRAGDGVWTDCDGDFHRTRADELRERKASAAGFVRDYYRAVSRRRFALAWDMLGRRGRRQLGSFRQWRAGHRTSRGVTVTSTDVRLSGRRAFVSVSLRARDRDACSGRLVRQRFRGRWELGPLADSWVGVDLRIRKIAGGRVRLSKAECPAPEPPPEPPDSPGPPAGSCTPGYSPCIAPGSDVDCAGGSGNGPRYVEGPVRVSGDDPYGLDSDGDGFGCES